MVQELGYSLCDGRRRNIGERCPTSLNFLREATSGVVPKSATVEH
jgi:hypothetical protein